MKTCRYFIAGFLCVCALASARAGDAPSLFAAAPGPMPMAAPSPEMARSRAVAVDFAALQAAAASTGKALRLNLFDNTAFTAVIERAVANRTGSVSYSGRLAEDPLGEFSLVWNGDALVGVVRSPSNAALYAINGSPGGGTVVRQLIASDFGGCGNSPEEAAASPASAQEAGPGGSGQDASCGDDGPLAVLVLYTNVARAAAGTTAAMEAEVQLAVDTSNSVYANSGIGMRMRLTHTEEVAYNENGTFQNHLDRLTNTTDGVMDGVHALRNQYGADDVVLMVQDDDPVDGKATVCGLGWQMTNFTDAFETRAFAIVNRGCASSNFSFAHEVGHNLGCDHDRANMGSAQLYPYAFGYRFTGNPSGTLWRTVMAYDTKPASYTRIAYFSNPNVSFDGTPTGITPGQTNQADNALVINNTTLTATNWRRDTMWVQFGYGGQQLGCPAQPFATLGLATLAVPWTGTVIVRPGSSPSERITISKPMTITTSGGVATIGG